VDAIWFEQRQGIEIGLLKDKDRILEVVGWNTLSHPRLENESTTARKPSGWDTTRTNAGLRRRRLVPIQPA
jgi:hypothetical protein